MVRVRGIHVLVPIVGLIAALWGASPAHGATTIGHVVGTGPPAPLFCFPTCTLRQASLAPEDGLAADGLTAPHAGIVTRFRFSVVAANQDGNLIIRPRVLRGRGGVATADPVTLLDADGIQAFKTRLPIAKGDGIGVDVLPTVAPGNIGIGRGTAAGNSVAELFFPPLLDGGGQQSPAATAPGVLDMEAVIEPSRAAALKKCKRNHKKALKGRRAKGSLTKASKKRLQKRFKTCKRKARKLP